MNSKIFLTYDFKKIIFRSNNKISIINKYINNQDKDQLVSNKNSFNIYIFGRYLIKTFHGNFPFLFFFLVYLLANKTGKYFAQKIFSKK